MRCLHRYEVDDDDDDDDDDDKNSDHATLHVYD